MVYGHSLIIGQDEKGTKSMKSYAYLINVIHQFLFVMLLECMSFRFCFISLFLDNDQAHVNEFFLEQGEDIEIIIFLFFISCQKFV